MTKDLNLSTAPELAQLPEVAREAIRAHLAGEKPKSRAAPEGALSTAAPVFVTLRIDGKLRGCIGSLQAQCDDLVAETKDRAVAAATSDYRFPPLTADELPLTSIEVSVLRPLEPIKSIADLDPKKYGIEIRDHFGSRAVLLPDIEGVDTVEQQIAVTRQKARIGPEVPITVRRFEVIKIEEG